MKFKIKNALKIVRSLLRITKQVDDMLDEPAPPDPQGSPPIAPPRRVRRTRRGVIR